MKFELRTTIVASVILALQACGGSDPQPPVAVFNADAAFTNALGGSALTGLKAVGPAGSHFEASLAYTPLPDDSFMGIPTRQSLQTTTVGPAGEPPAVATVSAFYQTGPARLLGTVTGMGKTTVFTGVSQLPVAGTIGQSGVFAEGTAYASPALGSSIGTETLLWSIEPDTGATALACLTSVSRSMGAVSTEKDCFRIDGAGNISGGTISVDRPGLSLYFVRAEDGRFAQSAYPGISRSSTRIIAAK